MINPIGAFAQLHRAKEHFQELELCFNDWRQRASREGYSVSSQRCSQGTEIIISVSDTAKPPPIRCQVLIGEVLHCLRVALDYLAYDLAIEGGANGKELGQVQFPIRELNDSEARKDINRRIGKVKVTPRAAIESLQPYNSPNPFSDTTWILHRLDNLAKHRLLPVVVCAARAGKAFVVGAEGNACVQIGFGSVEAPWIPLKPGTEYSAAIARHSFRGKVKVQAECSLGIQFRETDGLCDGEFVSSLLDRLTNHVEKILADIVAVS